MVITAKQAWVTDKSWIWVLVPFFEIIFFKDPPYKTHCLATPLSCSDVLTIWATFIFNRIWTRNCVWDPKAVDFRRQNEAGDGHFKSTVKEEQVRELAQWECKIFSETEDRKRGRGAVEAPRGSALSPNAVNREGGGFPLCLEWREGVSWTFSEKMPSALAARGGCGSMFNPSEGLQGDDLWLEALEGETATLGGPYSRRLRGKDGGLSSVNPMTAQVGTHRSGVSLTLPWRAPGVTTGP